MELAVRGNGSTPDALASSKRRSHRARVPTCPARDSEGVDAVGLKAVFSRLVVMPLEGWRTERSCGGMLR